MDRETAMRWWKYLDVVAHNLEADCDDGRPDMVARTPINPRHTADCLKGEAMLCAADVDEHCRSFALTRIWSHDLSGDHVFGIQLRLGCAKFALDYMTLYPRDQNAIALQSVILAIPDPSNEAHFIECLLIPFWRLCGDIFIEEQARQLQTLLAPGELQRLWAENPPLKG